MRKITETEYQMGEKEFKEKLGLDGEINFIIIKKASMRKTDYKTITIKTRNLTVEK